jgi:hypothetical protein
MWFLIVGLVVGMFAGVFVMCLMQMAHDPFDVDTDCTGDCNQGRNCTCATCKRCYGIGYDSSGQHCVCTHKATVQSR